MDRLRGFGRRLSLMATNVRNGQTTDGKPIAPTVSAETKRAYELKLSQVSKENSSKRLDHYLDETMWKKVTILKKGSDLLGMFVVPTQVDAVVPGAVVSELTIGGAAHSTGKILIGDQLMTVNGASVIGKAFPDIVKLLKGVAKGVEIRLSFVDGGGKLVATSRQTHFNAESSKNIADTFAIFTEPKCTKQVTIKKKPGEALGMVIAPTTEDAALPSAFISSVGPGSPVARQKEIGIGDQLMKINGQSVVGIPFPQIVDIVKGVVEGGEVYVEIVPIKVVSEHTMELEKTAEAEEDNAEGASVQGGNHGVQLNQGRVTHISEDSPAWRAGLKVGMYVMMIGDQGVYGWHDDVILERFDMLTTPSVKLICMRRFTKLEVEEYILKSTGKGEEREEQKDADLDGEAM